MDLPRSFGPYTLVRRLAVGGMAEVYVAKTQGLGGFEKQVAIKLVHPHLSADEHFVRMLIDEAKVLVKLSHANIAQVLDLGCIEGDYYIAMEYVDGWTLHHVMRAASQLRHPLPPELAAFVMGEVCAGLDHAHRKRDDDGRPLNLVHRDVSPQNILISQAGEVKLVDFGIAKGTHRRAEGTEVGVIKGKYNYMSPEQAWADPMDGRSDVFSAGVVLWEMLAGRMLYETNDVPKLIAEVRQAHVPPLDSLRRDVPPLLSWIVARATAREAADRFQSAAEMVEALRDFVYRHAPPYNSRRLSGTIDSLMEHERRAQERGELPKDDGGLPSLSRADLPRDRGSILPVVTRNDALSKTSSGRPRRSLPPLPFDSIAPPTDKMTQPPVAPPARVSSWPAPERPDTIPFTRPAAEGPRSTGTWEGAPISEEEEATDETLVDGSYALRAAAAELLEPSSASLQGGTPVLGPGFDTEPTARYRPQHVRSAARPRDARDTRDALRPPASGVEPIPSMPPSAPLPDVTAAGRLFRQRNRSRNALLALVGALLTFAGAWVAWHSFRVPSEPSALEILSVPSGAVVSVDGDRRAGITPLKLERFAPGQDYELVVEKEGYAPWAGTYHAAPGTVQHIAVLKPEQAELLIATDPAGATLWIDGVEVGTSPLRVSALDPGRRITVRASLEGYRDASRSLQIDARQLRPRLDIELSRGR